MAMKIYYFNSSHWDREWYQPFQHFRMYLLDMVRELLDTLENNPEFKVFNFDGQAVILEDVLAVHPEWRDRLVEQISSGRLNVGPWYVQPDEFLVSGEALIRNLSLGHQTAINFGGKPWPVGYLCDTFGHIAQMPQILNGFGIDFAVVWRGLPDDAETYFRWLAPDGSECLTVRLPENQGYGDFTGRVVGFWNETLTEAEFKAKTRIYIDGMVCNSSTPLIVLMDGVDHAPVHAAAPQYVQWIKELYPEAEVRISGLTELNEELRILKPALSAVTGELAFTARQPGGFMNLISHTLSSYYPLKQANDECQTDLELKLSPLMAWAGLNGYGLDNNLVQHAWKYLIVNQAHDSICGCSIDQVHRDMEYRFDQVRQIAGALESEFTVMDRYHYTGTDIRQECHHISGGIPNIAPNGRNGNLAVRFFNPLPYDYEAVTNFEIVFPCEYSATYAETFGYETLNSFRLKDVSGKSVAYNITAIERNRVKRFYRYDARQYNCYRVTAAVKLKALGWSTYTVEPSLLPVRYFESQLTGTLKAETAILRLEVNSHGTLSVTDKRNGRTYAGLNSFIADAEIGDGWNHVAPRGAPVIYSSGISAAIRLLEDSPGRTRFEITQFMLLPEEIVYAGTLQEKYRGITSSAKAVELKITTKVSLDAGSSLVQFETAIDNCAKDYRLRLRIPTGIQGEYFAHQTFCFMNRAAGRSSGSLTADWKEPEQLEKNFSDIAGKRDESGGIAFFSAAGIHEVAAPDNDDGALLFTMMRAFRRTVATNGEDQCQLQDRINYRYALYFIGKDEKDGEIYRSSQLYRTPYVNYTVHENTDYSSTDDSLLSLDSENVIASIVKIPEDETANTLVVRLVNFARMPSHVTLNLFKDIFSCQTINLKEEFIENLQFDHKKVTLTVPVNGIVSLRINTVHLSIIIA